MHASFIKGFTSERLVHSKLSRMGSKTGCPIKLSKKQIKGNNWRWDKCQHVQINRWHRFKKLNGPMLHWCCLHLLLLNYLWASGERIQIDSSYYSPYSCVISTDTAKNSLTLSDTFLQHFQTNFTVKVYKNVRFQHPPLSDQLLNQIFKYCNWPLPLITEKLNAIFILLFPSTKIAVSILVS